MGKRASLFAIALSLTVLETFVTVHYSWPAWRTWPGNTWNRELLVMMAAIAAASLANLSTQAIQPIAKPRGKRYV